MKVPPTILDNVVATLLSDVVVTLWQRSTKVVTTSQSRNVLKALPTFFQRCVKVVSGNILEFLGKLPSADYRNWNV